jgi:cytochrome c55X
LVVQLALATAAHADDLTATDTARLANLVRQDCGSCHGLTLKGGLGRPLLPKDLEHYEVAGLAEVILHGIPKTAMPGWDRIINQREAEWIAGALKAGKIAQ